MQADTKKRPPGRPKLPAGSRQVKASVWLYPAEVERLTARYGSVNAGIRKLVTTAMQS
jgi:hypothetical protein